MKKIFSFILIILLIFGVVAYFYVNNYIDNSLKEVDINNNATVLIEIPVGSSTNDIADILFQNNLIKDTLVFKFYAKKTNNDSKLKAGSFKLSKNMNVEEILDTLINKGVSGNTLNITIVEGLTLQETAKSISEQTTLNYEKLLSLMENIEIYKTEYKFLMDNPEIKTLQGYLMPDTYNVYKNASEEQIIKMLLSQFDGYYVAEFKPLLEKSGLSLDGIINLASIVEKEAVLDEERDEIAAAFLNRLKINMKLQSCATVNYAHGEWKESLTLEDIAIDSPYNTYIIEGLPPTAINSPGRACINAVLNPADVDYLFFVAKGDGSHYFSNNYEDHLEAIEKYNNN
ncbi:MAG: uncharacterized protein K0Q97_614 [Bacillota bacterium]|nr:uncharacterized protein [Bacillota bacterium]